MLKLIFIVGLFIITAHGEQYDGCDSGWFRYEDHKCVYIYDLDSTYAESETYCAKNFGANMLTILDDTERIFWTFYLLKYKNIRHNVWLQRPGSLHNTNLCLALRSKYSKDNQSVGSIIREDCEGSGSTVCEIATNKPVKAKEPARVYNPNEILLPNIQLKLANGSSSNFFTGVYYVLISKFKDSPFSNSYLANGKCTLDGQGGSCPTMYHDESFNDENSNYYMFATVNDNLTQFQIRRFNSDKLLIYEPGRFLSNYQCGSGSLTKMGMKICKQLLNANHDNYLWQLTQYKDQDYYIITSSKNHNTLGAKLFDIGKNGTVAFGLYDPVNKNSDVDDKFLFKIEAFKYTLTVDLYTLELNENLEKIVRDHLKKIDIMESETIDNNSPASLTHKVASSKDFLESFSTSYGKSQQFMESISRLAARSEGLSDTNSQSRSFTDASAHAISSILSDTVTDIHSNTETKSSSSSRDSGKSVNVDMSIPIPFTPLTLDLGYGLNFGSGSMSSNYNSHTSTKSSTNSNSSTNTNENSYTKSNENLRSHSCDTSEKKSTNRTKQISTTTDKRTEQSGSSQRTYSVFKTVSLPPFSSVRISSYANWINDLQIPFNLTLKFSVKSFRKQMDASGFNYWRTMDSAFVKHIMKLHLFNGNIKKEFFDSVYGEISGYLRASVGLESVFIVNEMKLN